MEVNTVFLDELTPFLQELSRQPVAFVGGIVSGALRLNLEEDPVKSWLAQQAGKAETTPPSDNPPPSDGPQKISID
jgi:hypothetical protein